MTIETDEEMFEVNGATDLPVSNLLEKGRYRFVVKEVGSHISKAGNNCVDLKLDIDGKWLFTTLITTGKMEWKWRQFLFAVGIRDRREKFSVTKTSLLGKQGLVDVIVEDKAGYSKNEARSFSPIEKEEAPIKGVEPENEVDQPESKPETVDEL